MDPRIAGEGARRPTVSRETARRAPREVRARRPAAQKLGSPGRAPRRRSGRSHVGDRLRSRPSTPTSPTASRRCRSLHGPRGRRCRRRSSTSAAAPASPGSRSRSRSTEPRSTCVEATARKCRFIERAIGAARPARMPRVVCARAEEWAARRGRRPLRRGARASGRAAADAGRVREPAAARGRRAGRLEGRTRTPPRSATRRRRGGGARDDAARGRAGRSVPGRPSRHLHVFEKTAPTPAGYPARAGRGAQAAVRGSIVRSRTTLVRPVRTCAVDGLAATEEKWFGAESTSGRLRHRSD